MSQYWNLNLVNIISNSFCLDNYNDLVLLTESVIAISILSIMMVTFLNKWFQNFKHWIMLELIWTMCPVLLLLILGLPSIEMVYLLEVSNLYSNLILKVTGFQWYWNYSFPEFNILFDSYPLTESKLFRLGESNLLVLPISVNIRFLISSSDVIHSWSLPSIGVKMDAIPGRLNLLSAEIFYINKHLGQCSELCGNYHSWMPIFLETTSTKIFSEWLKVLI